MSVEKNSNYNLDELIGQRKKILTELYCVSRLSEILEIKNDSAFEKDLNEFLEKNEIRKGRKFDVGSLPPMTQSATAVPLNNGDNSASFTNISSIQYDDDEDGDTESKDVKGNNVPNSSSSEIFNKNLGDAESLRQIYQKKRGLDMDDDNGFKSLKRQHTTENDTDKEVYATKKGKYSLGNFQQSMYHQNQVYHVDLNLIKAKPTPIPKDEKYSTKILENIERKNLETVDYFKEKNINAVDSIYLLMEDNIPSKIPHSLPLAELKYVAQTLPLIKLLPMAHKAVTTDIINNALNEGRITVVSSRIEELRRLGLWSLRQPKKFIDPWEDKQTHNSIMLNEAKWMHADFKEGKKYKIASCIVMAQAVMDYWTYGKCCCINAKAIVQLPKEVAADSSEFQKSTELTNNTVESELKPDGIAEALPINDEEEKDSSEQQVSIETNEIQVEVNAVNPKDLDSSDHQSNTTESNSIHLEVVEDSQSSITEPTEVGKDITMSNETLVPKLSAVDNLSLDEIVSSPMHETTTPFKLFLTSDDLKPKEMLIFDKIPKYTGVSDEFEHIEPENFVPISKSLVTLEHDNFYKLIERQLTDDGQSWVPLSKKRGMFFCSRRSHYLKPPMAPSLRYLTNRSPTIWLPEDDEALVKNINAYAYNWELISSHMVCRPRAAYYANIERRTPWQCFERFVQLNEKFNFNDLKGPRAHAAQQWLIEAHKFQQRQNRRISPLGVSAESIQRGHRRLRWASMFEAIRKAIKKRENAPRPNPTQPRKPLDAKNMKVPSPAEMSDLKAQRDEALRRDLQMRRNAKNRIQQHQRSQQAQQQKLNNKLPSNGSNSNLNASSAPANNDSNGLSTPSVVSQTPLQRPPNRQLTEQEIIKSYSRKILHQKPNLSPETALKAARNYYNSIKEQKLKQQRLQENSIKSNDDKSNSASQTNIFNNTNLKDNDSMIVSSTAPSDSTQKSQKGSPTPQEILQRYQK